MDTTNGRQFAVVTGASSGIGRELAKQFAAHGFDLLITATGPALAEAAGELRALGATVETITADLATYDGVESLYRAIRAAGRPVDAIAINAGVGVGGDFTRQTDLQDELNLIQLNIAGTVHLAKRVLPDLVARGVGRVLFVQSFAEALRNELKDTGVTITALQPGPTDTNFFHQADMEDTNVGQSKKDDLAIVAKQGFDALMAGKDHVIAGSLLTKVQGKLAKVMPDTATAQMHRGMAEPDAAKQ
jgi:short-subunit dehydrogenase